MFKKIFKIIFILICGVIGGILAQAFLLPFLAKYPYFEKFEFVKQFKEREVVINKTEQIIVQENKALTEAVEKAEKTVAGVKTETKTKEILEGSGLIVTNDGLIITLAELVPTGSVFSFYLEDKKVGFQILKRDKNFALIKTEGQNLATAGFGDFNSVKLGQRVFLIGLIFEKGKAREIVNEGIVASISQDFIQTNILEKENLKGSPLFDIEGRVVGINTVNEEGKISAIPVSKIKEFLGF